jgi:hypothetical protein
MPSTTYCQYTYIIERNGATSYPQDACFRVPY